MWGSWEQGLDLVQGYPPALEQCGNKAVPPILDDVKRAISKRAYVSVSLTHYFINWLKYALHGFLF